MATPVWTWEYDYPLDVEQEFEETELDLGPGHEIVVSRDVAHTLADGTGQVTARVGRFVFKPKVNRANYAGDQQFISILRFLQARKAANEAFYFYNAHEEPNTANWNGTSIPGRYLVVFKGKIPYSVLYKRTARFSLTFYEFFA